MGLFSEFRDFLSKHQVLGLAVAFIIGVASTKLVTALVNDVIMPIVSVFIGGGDWRTAVWQVGSAKLLVGDFAGSLIDFVIIALVIFLIVKTVSQEKLLAK